MFQQKHKKTTSLNKNFLSVLSSILMMDEEQRNAYLAIAQKIVEENEKNNVQGIDVGDRVLFWDLSRLMQVHENGDSDYYDYSPQDAIILTTKPSIVSAVKINYLSEELNREIVLDLEVFNSTLNKKFRTSSMYVKTFN